MRVDEPEAVTLGNAQGSITCRPVGTILAAGPPQHSTAPAAETAQTTFAAPAAMATRGVDDTAAGTGLATLPQHVTTPSSDNEQEKVQPAAMATCRDATDCGGDDSPEPFEPQQVTPPVAEREQLW